MMSSRGVGDGRDRAPAFPRKAEASDKELSNEEARPFQVRECPHLAVSRSFHTCVLDMSDGPQRPCKGRMHARLKPGVGEIRCLREFVLAIYMGASFCASSHAFMS